MARRNRKRESEGIFALLSVGIILGMIKISFDLAVRLLSTWEFQLGAGLSTVVLGTIFYHKFKKKRDRANTLRDEIGKVEVSEDRAQYLIDKDDYRRGNAKENVYRKLFQLPLLKLYGNCCAKCGSSSNGLDLDHFFISKNEGGSFIMRHQSGHLVNNAVPLCQSCNRSKSDDSFKDFFKPEEVLRLFQLNVQMTKLLNETEVLDTNGEVIKQRKRSA